MVKASFMTEEHELFRKSLRKMLDKEAYPYFEEWEAKRDIPRVLAENGGEWFFMSDG